MAISTIFVLVQYNFLLVNFVSVKKEIQKGGGGQSPPVPPPEVVTGVRGNAPLENFENLTPRKSDLAPNGGTCCPGEARGP